MSTQTGDHMSDTIELLEAIGRDASLRHASSEDLTSALLEAQASQALTAAVASGDSSKLAEEFGQKVNLEPQAIQHPGYEEDEPEAPSTSDDEKSPDDDSTK
jgi:hypothetical protein